MIVLTEPYYSARYTIRQADTSKKVSPEICTTRNLTGSSLSPRNFPNGKVRATREVRLTSRFYTMTTKPQLVARCVQAVFQDEMCHQKLTISWFAVVLLASPLMAIWELEKDVYVVEVDWSPGAPGERVVLTCDTPEEDDIFWTSDKSSEVVGSGKTLTIQVKEFSDAGQYTCHKGGETLSHSRLLLHKKEGGIWSTDILKDQKDPKNKTFLKCEAANYSGRFTCWWLTAVSTDLKFNIKSSIKPDPPKNLQLKPLKGSQMELSWEYPDSWSTPHSYFSLKFHVQVRRKKEKKDESQFVDKTSAEIRCNKGAEVRVRAQDHYYNSFWSKWVSVPCS
ncbi:interleukin 12b [Cricetulus griseus]